MDLRIRILGVLFICSFSCGGQTEIGSSIGFVAPIVDDHSRYVPVIFPGGYVIQSIEDKIALKFEVSSVRFSEREMNTNCYDCGSRRLSIRGIDISAGLILMMSPNDRRFGFDFMSSIGVFHYSGAYTYYNHAWGFSSGLGWLDNTFSYYEPGLAFRFSPLPSLVIRLGAGARIGWNAISDWKSGSTRSAQSNS
ncbi:MAG: hypothetical protein HON12_06280 [Flavobacteriales bacterium]|jgi:hypothetical protein|nr:hypothetical protein [Flavobacteriales bacterium]